MERNPFMTSQTLLKTIPDVVKQFSEVIAKTADADVRIVDHDLNVVGETVLYYRLSPVVGRDSVIGQVLAGQKRIVCSNRRQSEICRACASYEGCQICALAGVPVFYKGRVIGVIALLFPGHRQTGAFPSMDAAADFAKRMAKLLVGNIRDRDELAAVRRGYREFELILDQVEDGVVCTDSAGEILYCSQAFLSMFGWKEIPRGENLKTLLPNRLLREFFQKKQAFRNLKVSLEQGGYSFCGFLSCREISAFGGEKRFVFCFRPMDHIWAAANRAGSGSLVTLEWGRGWLFSEETVERAKRLAAAKAPVLILGPEECVNEMAAKAICNYSDRSGMGIVPVYCNNLYREFFEQFLFSGFGELKRAMGGTLVFYNVDRLPIYLQERLLDFMKTGLILPEDSEPIHSDVRLLFTTTKDLKELVREGLFLEKLYYHLEGNLLSLDSYYGDRVRLAETFESGVSFYGSRYEKTSVKLSRSAEKWLLGRDWGGDPNEVDQVLEKIIRNGKGTVTEKDLEAMGIRRLKELEVSAISDLERERIIRLLRAGCSKVEIARLLGIGRATLYRKMAEYQLDYRNEKGAVRKKDAPETEGNIVK